jgi:hypothetical protein
MELYQIPVYRSGEVCVDVLLCGVVSGGVVWSGVVVWCGAVWCGVVWCGRCWAFSSHFGGLAVLGVSLYLIAFVYQEFLAHVAHKVGKLKKGGVPDYRAAAVTVLRDWQSGKIKFFTLPPERTEKVRACVWWWWRGCVRWCRGVRDAFGVVIQGVDVYRARHQLNPMFW